jgi:hypothetical protein
MAASMTSHDGVNDEFTFEIATKVVGDARTHRRAGFDCGATRKWQMRIMACR